MLIIGIDIETTGLNADKDAIIEFAAVLWDTRKNVPMKIVSELIYDNINKIILSKVITDLTSLDTKDLEKYGSNLEIVKEQFINLLSLTNVCCVHNGIHFDRQFIENSFDKTSLPTIQWIDTSFDIPYPESIKTRKLDYLCYEHGFSPLFKHRALFDVFSMLKILSQYDYEEILHNSKHQLVSCLVKIDYENRHTLKEKGFFWNSERRMWQINCRENRIPKIDKAYDLIERIF